MTGVSTPSESPSPAPRSPIRLIALGMLVLQLAWLFAVPPVGGSDEFDHVYKAAAVARGDWVPTPSAATRGTGAWLEVPSDIVRAARPQCVALPYTRAADCYGEPHGDMTRVASGAGRYHPLYYFLVGTPALPFSGHTAVYVMRIVSMLICWVFFCLALVAARAWSRTSWPLAAVTIAATPVLLYSTAIVAPNGLEMIAAIAFWASLVGVVQGVPATRERLVLSVAAASGAVLVTTRSLGPLWCLLAALSVVLTCWPGRETALRLLRDRRLWIVAGVIGLATAQSVAWILTMGSLTLNVSTGLALSLSDRLSTVAQQVPVWVFQSIAAFPLRDEPTHPVVYVCYLTLFVVLLGLAMRAASCLRQRLGLAVTIAVAVLVPFAISVESYNTHPDVWQGRYGLPYAVGMSVLAGFVLDRTSRSRLSPRARLSGLLLFVLAQSVGPVDVMRRAIKDPLDDFDAWARPPVAVVALLAAVGAGVLWWASTRIHAGPGPLQDDAAERPRLTAQENAGRARTP